MRLLYLSNEEIESFIDKFDKDAKALKEELYKLAWFMRGSLSFTEAYLLSPEDREIIGKIVEKNLETTKETKLPFF